MQSRARRGGAARRAGMPQAALALLLALAGSSCGTPAPTPLPRPDPRIVSAAITEEGLGGQLRLLEEDTTGSERFRAVGSAGYARSATRIARTLREAGWTVTEVTAPGITYADDGTSTLEVGGVTHGAADVHPLVFSPAGTVEGPVVALDWDADAIEPTGAGCFATQYRNLPPRAIVVVRSGPCLRRDQVLAAQAAGAAAFVAVYPALPDGAILRPTLIRPDNLAIPAVGVSRTVALALVAAAATGGTARLTSNGRTQGVTTTTILAELPGSEPTSVVMLGAHLDSVLDGPGINDDGSGVAALLEIARALTGTRARATIRLAFWSGEELGIHGSFEYASALTDEQRRAIRVYLNADMLASPNGFAGVYQESGAAYGSTVVREILAEAVRRAGLTPVDVDLSGNSDHFPFAQAGIPTGGVFAGALTPVAPAEAAGGATAGRPADPCYHQVCDDVANANIALARALAAALADTAVRLANTPELLPR